MPNRIRVRLFAIQRELIGAREIALDLPPGATVEGAWTALVERHPVLAPGQRPDPNVPRVNNGVTGDPRPSTPEIGKLVVEMKVNNAVAEINRLIAARTSAQR